MHGRRDARARQRRRGHLGAEPRSPRRRNARRTMTSCVFSYDAGGKHVSLVDTPGDSELRRRRADRARGARRRGTGRLRRATARRSAPSACGGTAASSAIPIVAFVNGLDRERAYFDAALESLERSSARSRSRSRCRSASTRASQGVVDLLDRPREHARRARAIRPAELAAEIAASAREPRRGRRRVRRRDPREVPRGGRALEEDLRQALVSGTRDGSSCPCCAAPRRASSGIQPLLHAIADLLPSAADAPPRSQSASGERGGARPRRAVHRLR